MKRFAVIVGGGSGTRMVSDVPKQFMDFDGMPLILKSALPFLESSADTCLIFVVPKAFQGAMKTICKAHGIAGNAVITEGGPTRFHSVKNGLKFVDDDEALVAIHDSVRPLISPSLVNRCFAAASGHGAAIPVVPVHDSVRMKDGALSKPVDRSNLVLVQTPQCFKASVIKKAYNVSFDEKFTDDATVAENDGISLCLVEGEPENIKITTPSDLAFARAISSRS